MEHSREKDLAQEPVEAMIKKSTKGNNSGTQRTFCENCLADITNDLGGITVCWHCGAPVEQTVFEQRNPSSENRDTQLLLDEPLTSDSCVRILTLLGYQVHGEQQDKWTATSPTGSKRFLHSFEDLCQYTRLCQHTRNTAKEILATEYPLQSSLSSIAGIFKRDSISIWVVVGIWLLFTVLHMNFDYDPHINILEYFSMGLGSTLFVIVLPLMIALVGKWFFKKTLSGVFLRSLFWIGPALIFLMIYGWQLE